MDSRGCWNYGDGRPGSYPIIYVQGEQVVASRYSFLLTRGVLPVGMDICHRCDNPKCVNPFHLWATSHRFNMIDAAQKKSMRDYHRHTHDWSLTVLLSDWLRREAKKR